MERSGEEKLLIARAADVAQQCGRQYSVKYMGFLTPAEAAAIGREMPAADAALMFYGGYPDAERKLFVALPEYADGSECDELIAALEITGRDIDGLSHRDYLGSILGLGIRREKIGDILVCENRCIVFVLEDIADYIVLNLEKVGRHGVKIRRIEPGTPEIPERKTEKINTVVASLRLDCIVSAAMKTSRARAAAVINSGRVSLNWTECTDVSAAVKAGDTLSVKGAGRFILSAGDSDGNGDMPAFRQTKKGRLAVCIEKLI